MRKFVPPHTRQVPPNATQVFQGVIFDVYHWEQELFDGSTKTFEMLKRPDSVVVIAIKGDKIIVLEEEQPGDTSSSHSFPGGRSDLEDEDELQAAQRELLEETGLTFSNWKLIAAVQPHAKIDWIVYTFLATEFVSQVDQTLDAGEKIVVTERTVEEIKELNKDPNTHYLGRELFEEISSTQELADLPELST